jgi:hypothetical protein
MKRDCLWCSNDFKISCDNGQRACAALALDCSERKATKLRKRRDSGRPGRPARRLADVALLGQYTAASFVGPAGAFGGTPTYDSPPAATLEQTLTQPLHS